MKLAGSATSSAWRLAKERRSSRITRARSSGLSSTSNARNESFIERLTGAVDDDKQRARHGRGLADDRRLAWSELVLGVTSDSGSDSIRQLSPTVKASGGDTS